jgi:hypothetical protein
MPRSVGQDESEESHYGGGNAQTEANVLETQNRQSGGWGLWTNLQCDESQNSLINWDATKYTNSLWATTQTPPDLC